MKKVILILCLLLLTVLPALAVDFKPSPVVTFSQDQESFEFLTQWELEIASSENGPWNLAVTIPKPDDFNSGGFAGSYTINLGAHPIGTELTRYFRLIAVNVNADPDFQRSGHSNVVSHTFNVTMSSPIIISIEIDAVE